MSQVSIVMPAYNRADTIQRAIRSVQAQTYQDWELVVVDDGSTDGTAKLVDDRDPRIKLIRQENRGFVGARNTGILAGTGEYIAFLDSDDEWMPHHLELGVSFLDAHPEAKFVASELLEDFGQGHTLVHYRIETADWYPGKAATIRSNNFALPAGKSDNYLRVYETREPIGEWGRQVFERLGRPKDAFHYSGNIFEQLRWGFLIAVNSMILRRTTLETVGLQQAKYNVAADYHFMGLLCLNFRANFLSIPTYVKHELTAQGEIPSESHLATGKTALSCAKEMLCVFEDLFWNHRRNDRELSALRGLAQFNVAESALNFRERETALHYLKETRKSFPRFWRATALLLFVTCFPDPDIANRAWEGLNKGSYAVAELFRGELSAKMILRKTRSKGR